MPELVTKRVHLIANKKSGIGRGGTLTEEARAICNELGFEMIEYDFQGSQDCEAKIRQAVDAAEKDHGTLIAAGGDGTIRSVAQAALGRAVRFAVVPCGTFNFFARTHQLPEDHLEAFRLALQGQTQPVRLGTVNEHVFLNNASLGLYSKAIREREHRTDRFGRNRIVVILSTILTFFSKHLLLKVDLVAAGKVTSLYTPMIFIGNNTLQMRDLAPQVARCMKENLLAVVLMKPIRKREIFRILIKGILKTLDKEESLDSFCVDEMVIYTKKHSHHLVLDGELIQVQSPFRVKALPDALNLVKPAIKGPE